MSHIMTKDGWKPFHDLSAKNAEANEAVDRARAAVRAEIGEPHGLAKPPPGVTPDEMNASYHRSVMHAYRALDAADDFARGIRHFTVPDGTSGKEYFA